jgi:hypothetical protein
VVSQAVGMTMSKRTCSAHEALAFLDELADIDGIRVEALAESMVKEHEANL